MSGGSSRSSSSECSNSSFEYTTDIPTWWLALHFLAGLGTGVFSASLLQPADLLKTRVQQPGSPSLLVTIREIAKTPNSLRQFWRGTTPSIVRTGLGSALYFSILNALRQNVASSSVLTSAGVVVAAERKVERSSLPKLSNTGNLATGAVARVSAGFIMTPITVIKVRYESSFYSYKSIREAASSIWKAGGMKGFFSGFGATAVRDAPYAGLYVVFYEQCKSRLTKLQNNPPTDEPMNLQKTNSGTTVSINFLSGLVAACFATTITNPFDATKTRLQLSPERYRNMVQASRKMVQEDGLWSLFNGLGLRIGRKAISSALTWTLYEELIRRADLRLRESDGGLT